MELRPSTVNVIAQRHTEQSSLYHVDSVDGCLGFPGESIGLSLMSVPFPGMYAYTNSARDIGNVKDLEQMVAQSRYLFGTDGLLNATMPGRLCAVHLSQTMVHKNREGWIGLRDFRGEFIRLMVEEGWIYAGEATIDKNPQQKASRTKELGLLYKTLATDSTLCRPTLADYLLLFKKPGQNPEPVKAAVHEKYNPGGGWVTTDEWNEWASAVWYRWRPGIKNGIREGRVLNVRQAKDTDDERHLCPLQLDVIERAIKLYSNPGDLVYDPFGGIGSVPYVAVQLGRKGVASELKASYFKSMVENVSRAEIASQQGDLFTASGVEVGDAELDQAREAVPA
jgi:hypothetical protein